MILFPEGSGRVKQFRVPRFLLSITFLFLISWAASLFLLFWNYHAARIRISGLARLEKEERRSHFRLRKLERQIEQFSLKMDKYEEFALNVEYLLDPETGLSSPHFLGMGGSEADLWLPSDAEDEEFKYQAQLLHRALDEMNERISCIEQGQAACRTYMINRKLLLARVRPPWPTKEGGENRMTPEGNRPIIHTLSPSSQSLQPLPSFP